MAPAVSALPLSKPAERIARFIQVVPGRRPPRRAERTVGGILPVRALRYCEPISAASAFGWLIFLPRRLRLLYDGSEIFYQFDGMDDFLPLRSVVYPGFSEVFDEAAPEGVKGYAPPAIAASPQAGVMQTWPGSMVRTAPGWSLLVRPVANLPRPTGYEIFEGIIETDTWFGPLFTNIRLTRTDIPIELDDDVPFMQVQPVRKRHYDEEFLANFVVDEDLESLTADDWRAYADTAVEPSQDESRKLGHYAAAVRKAAAARRGSASEA